jgi:hypothetical protein
VSTPENPSRDDLLSVLGAPPGTSVTSARYSYLRRRLELLAADPDTHRPEVVRLDGAFTRLREAAELERRLRGYQRARVRIGVDGATVEVRPAPAGTADGDFPFDGIERVHVLTAFNPRNQRLRPQDNAHRQRVLTRRVDATGLPSWPAVGGGSTHDELSIAVAGLSRARARALGAEFEQDAIFEWSQDAWTLIPCDALVDARDLGWRVTRAAAPLPDPLAVPRPAPAAGAATRAAAAAAETAAIARARRLAGGGCDDAGERTVPPGQDAAPRDLPASRGGAGE